MKQFFLMKQAILFLAFLFASYALQAQTTIYITSNGAGNQSGNTWANAAPGAQLQDKINNAASRSQIWVAAGTYTPDAFPNDCSNCGTDTRNYTFMLRNGVALYGGFAGTETILSQRNINANSSILSGDVGIAGDSTDNCYHLIISAYNDSTAVLDGFTCTDANANGIDYSYISYYFIPQNFGGGIYNYSSSPKIVNCNFLRNRAAGGNDFFNSDAKGAGMYNDASSPHVANCSFAENTTIGGNGGTSGGSGYGTGMCNYNSSPHVANCSFTENTTIGGNGVTSGGRGYGIGMYNENSSPQVTNCSFIRNMAIGGSGNTIGGSGYGAGMYNENSSPVIRNCYFIENKTTGGSSPVFGGYSYGAGIYNTYYAGETYNTPDALPRIINCVFLNNVAAGGNGEAFGGTAYGGGMYNVNCSAQVINSTFSKNTAGIGGAVYVNGQVSVTISNSIIYDNTANYLAELGYGDINTVNVNYSLIKGGFNGTGNLDVDPHFKNSDDADGADDVLGTPDDGFNLSVGSLAIDAGSNDSIPVDVNTDITGAERIQNGTVDLGAYEFGHMPITPSVSITANPGSTICAGTNVTFTATPVNGGTTPVYQWRKNGVATGTNSDTYTTNELNNNDVIAVQLTSNTTGLSSPTATDSLIIKVNALPIAALFAQQTSVCYGANVQLTATAQGGTKPYQFSFIDINRGTGTAYGSSKSTLKPAGTYAVSAKDSKGCIDTSNSVTITQPASAIATSATVVNGICGGKGAITVSANGGYGSFVYQINSSTETGKGSSYTFNNLPQGTYTVTAIDANGCSKSKSVTVGSNNKVPAPANFTGPATVTASSTVAYSVDAVDGVSYTWAVPSDAVVTSGQGTASVTITWGYKSGKIKITPVASCGNGPFKQYSIIVTHSNTAKTAIITANSSKENGMITVKTTDNFTASVYPNPATTMATLSVGSVSSELKVYLTDLNGKVLWKIEKVTGSNIKIPVANLANGMYLIVVQDKEQRKTLKLVKAE